MHHSSHAHSPHSVHADKAKEASLRSFFANRFVQSILLSAVFLQLGIWIRNFAVLLFVTEQTNKDPVAISLISLAEFAPIFIFSFIGGAFADRWRPKRTMVLCDAFSAISVFGVLAALMFGGWQAIFFATLVSSILSQFSQPAGMKLFKQHVQQSQLQMSMSMYQTVQAIFMVLGPMLGTLIYFRFGIQAAIGIMGICFLLSAGVLLFLPADHREEQAAARQLTQELKLGLTYVLANKLFLFMGGFSLAAGLALGLMNPMAIFLITEHLNMSAQSLQWFTAVNGAGMILGGMLVMGLSRKITPQTMLLVGFSANSLAVAVMGTTDVVWLAIAAQFLSGLMVPFIHVACQTIILTRAEEAFVGRVSGIISPLFIGGMVVNMSLVGPLKAVLPLSGIYLMAAGLFVIGALASVPLFLHRRQSQQRDTRATIMHH
ncbi:MFS transporter [Gordoniibacillus kamchatkensis]|uniref:MFS transporter n=1 Tax=Gordoniibacillus kamchatkensis TaxID=1590651 RepID=A0ABR5AD81_9BACL|nr:MFS transporter [Paenibacillus sp. VKM B-2647]KIL38989.1 MFS transporter [Paenibacillus sp. VKM B-2647]